MRDNRNCWRNSCIEGGVAYARVTVNMLKKMMRGTCACNSHRVHVMQASRRRTEGTTLSSDSYLHTFDSDPTHTPSIAYLHSTPHTHFYSPRIAHSTMAPTPPLRQLPHGTISIMAPSPQLLPTPPWCSGWLAQLLREKTALVPSVECPKSLERSGSGSLN